MIILTILNNLTIHAFIFSDYLDIIFTPIHSDQNCDHYHQMLINC